MSEALQAQEGRLRSLPGLNDTQADCVAKGLVDTPGTDALIEYGVLNSDLSVRTSKAPLGIPEQPATQMVDVVTGCTDLVQLQREGLADTQDPPAVKKCFERVLDESGVRRLLLSGLTGDKSALREMNKALSTCMAAGRA